MALFTSIVPIPRYPSVAAATVATAWRRQLRLHTAAAPSAQRWKIGTVAPAWSHAEGNLTVRVIAGVV